MKIEWTIVADGLGMASNGAATAIGVNQSLIVTTALPVTTKRAVLAHLVAESKSLADSELGISVRVLSPAGQVIAAQTASAKLGHPPFPDLPLTFDLFVEFPLRLADYGDYAVEVDVTGPDGTSAKGQASLYVRSPVADDGRRLDLPDMSLNGRIGKYVS